MRALLSIASLAGLVASVGCSGGSGTLSGTVTFKKNKLTQGQVMAVNPAGDTAYGTIQPDGTYRIENCPAGKVMIAVTSPDPEVIAKILATADKQRPPLNPPPPAPAADPKTWFAIPEMYSNPDTSGLVVEVSGSTTFNIDLE